MKGMNQSINQRVVTCDGVFIKLKFIKFGDYGLIQNSPPRCQRQAKYRHLPTHTSVEIGVTRERRV
jgi:hypothetical protein